MSAAPTAQGLVDINVKGAVTLDELRKIGRTLCRNAVPPMKVMNAAEAKRMTADDLAGHVWHVGEEYYRFEYGDGTYEFKHF